MKLFVVIKQKHVGFSQLSQNHYITIWGYFLRNFKKIHLLIEELYTRLYHWYMFEALSLLVYKRDPNSKGHNSIRILYFSFNLVPV